MVKGINEKIETHSKRLDEDDRLIAEFRERTGLTAEEPVDEEDEETTSDKIKGSLSAMTSEQKDELLAMLLEEHKAAVKLTKEKNKEVNKPAKTISHQLKTQVTFDGEE